MTQVGGVSIVRVCVSWMALNPVCVDVYSAPEQITKRTQTEEGRSTNLPHTHRTDDTRLLHRCRCCII